MIQSFANRLAEDLFLDRRSHATRAFPVELRRRARRKLLYLHEAVLLKDLRVPPGNRLEKLKGKLDGCHSIRISQQWRLVFKWNEGKVRDVQIVDYH